MQTVSGSFTTATYAPYRQLAYGVLVSWDKTTASGINYFTIGSSVIGGVDTIKSTGGGTIAAANEYRYSTIPASGVVGWSTSMRLDQYPYGLVQRQASVTLSNASTAYLPASGTSVGPYINSGRPVKILAGFGNETIPMFTGYSDSPENDINKRTIELHCFDASDYLNSYTSLATRPLQNKRADEIMATLLAEAGFSTSQYVLERSLNPTIAYFDPFGLTIGDLIQRLCEAEAGIFFADEAGILRFWNRQHFSGTQTPVATLTYSGIQTLSIQNSSIINYVTAASRPLALVSGTSQVFTLDQPYYLAAAYTTANNNISNPSFEVSTSGWSGDLVRTNVDSYVNTYSASGTNAVYDLTSVLGASADGIGAKATAQFYVKPTSGTWANYKFTGSAVNGYSIQGTQSGTVQGNGTWRNASLNAYHYATTAQGYTNAWNYSTNLPKGYIYTSGTTGSGYAYQVGGEDGSAQRADVYYAPIRSQGFGNWQLTSSYPFTTEGSATAYYRGYVYNVGGLMNGTATTSGVYYAHVNADGSLGSWTSTKSLNQARSYLGGVSTSGYIYAVGGDNNASPVYNNVEYAPINADGSLGTWVATNGLPAARSEIDCVAYNGYLYVVTGYSSTNLTNNNVYYAKINADGSVAAWSTGANFPVSLYQARLVATNGYLYVLGGSDGSTSKKTVYYAALNASTGAPGTWNSANDMLEIRNTGFVAGTDSRQLLVWGGANFGGYANSTMYTALASTGVTLTISGATGSFLLDAVTTDADDQYFDGNSTSNNAYSYSWNGTSGLSTSTRTGVPYFLTVKCALNAETYSIVQPTASGLNASNIGANQSYYSFSSISGTGGIYGTDLTANVSLVNYSVSGTTAFLTFQNNAGQQAYLTNLVLYGQTAEASSTIDQAYSDRHSIDQYRINPSNSGQPLDISNDYIPTSNAALGLCEYLVQGYGMPLLRYTSDTFAIPQLQFGDCVSLVNKDTGETRSAFVVGINNSMDMEGNFKQTLILQERQLTNYFTIGTSTIGGTSAIAP